MKNSFLVIILLAGCLAGCSTIYNPSIEKASAISWEMSREGSISDRQAYFLAEIQLSKLKRADSSKPLAVIMDLDETVLDNSDFQLSLVKHNQPYTEAAFTNWANTVSSGAVPGAVNFVKKAQASGFMVFFVTNRVASIKDATKSNLTKIGVKLDDNIDTVLCLGDKPEWGKDKRSRWNYVESKYTIAMYIGDSIYDFPIQMSKDNDIDERSNQPWGRNWILIPNPMYGSWER